MLIYALCGFQGSGKDTIADYLVHKYAFTKLAFGSVVKDVVSVIFGWDRELMEGISVKSRIFRETPDEWWAAKLKIPGFTPRMAMQIIGTDLFRDHFNSELWVMCLERRLSEGCGDRIVVSDCRFLNELGMLKTLGAKIIRVRREPITYTVNIHRSELEWTSSKFDIEILNENLDETKKQVDLIISETMI